MFQQLLNDVIAVFPSMGTVGLAVALVVLVALGLLLGKWSHLVSYTMAALTLLVIIQYVRLAVGGVPVGMLPDRVWLDAGVTPISVFVSHFVAFALVIGLVRMVRGLVRRG